MSQQGDLGFWPKNDGVTPHRVSSLAKKARYGVITDAILEEIFAKRMLTAGLLTRARDKKEAFWASLVLHTLTSIREELEGRIS